MNANMMNSKICHTIFNRRQLFNPPISSTENTHRSDIDGLRAVAIFFVVCFHAFPEWVNGGFVGVDIFFVISGFLISRSIFESVGQNNFSLGTFYARRINRIFPALIVALFGIYLFGWYTLLADEFKQIGKHIASSSTFIENFILWNEVGYFDNLAEKKPLLHLWSLAVEEQFYLFWPPILYVLIMQKIEPIIVIIPLIFVSFFLHYNEFGNDVAASFYLPQYRYWEFLIGAILARIYIDKKSLIFDRAIFKHNALTGACNITQRLVSNALYISDIASIFGILLIFFGFYFINRNSNFAVSLALCPVIGSALIIVAGPHAWINRHFLSHKIMVWFGLISYPLYLWHWPLLSLSRMIESDVPSKMIRLEIVALSIFLAWVTYKVVEFPLKSSRNNKVSAMFFFCCLSIIGLMGIYAFEQDGIANRSALKKIDDNVELVRGFGEDDASSHNKCLATYNLIGPIRYCNLSGSNRPRIALIGDSHARALYPGLKDILAQTGESLLQIGGRLYLDLAGYPVGRLSEIEANKGGIRATTFVAEDSSISVVIMVSDYATSYNIPDNVVFQLISNPDIKDAKLILELAMRKTFDKLLENHKHIIFVLTSPHINFDPRSCLDSRPFRVFSKTRSPCAMPRSEYDLGAKEYRDIASKVLVDYPDITVFDAANYLCDEKLCWAMKDGKILYWDESHLTSAGSTFLSREIAKLIKLKE